MTGNADPPGTGYIVTSNSTTSTSWKTGVAAILAVLGYTPVNKAGDTVTGSLVVQALGVVAGASVGTDLSVAGTTTSAAVVAANAAVSSALTAGSLGVAGAATVGGTLAVVGAQTNSSTLTATQFGSSVATGTPPMTVNSTTEVTNLNASRVAGKIPTATPSANALPLADASGKLDGWITALTPGAYVPSGLVAMFRTAAAIATGWTRETNLDGRIPVGAGTTFGITFAETVNSGTSWGYTPAGSVTVVIAANSDVNSAIKGITPGETSAASAGHGHGITSQTFTGTGVNTYDHMALRCYVYAIKT